VSQEGVSDLVHDGHKIGGSCIYRSRDLLYYSTTLLIDPDLELVERYLKHPPREPGYRRGRRHAEFMGSISRTLGEIGAKRLVEQLTSLVERDRFWSEACANELPACSSASR
jgi:lipoate-protein ligase A